jgi:chromosome segregation ATPase
MRLIPCALVAAGVIGCANAPSKSPVPSSTGASFDMFKNQVKQTAQAGSNLVQAGAQDLQNSVQSQMSQIDNQQRALQAQLNSTAGETRAALERRLQDVQTQKQAILTRMSDAQRSGAAGLDSTKQSINDSIKALQQTLEAPLPGPAPAAPAGGLSRPGF